MAPLSFHKLHGCGNDFIFIDNREQKLPVESMAAWAVKLCERKRGIGADGLVFLAACPPERAAEKLDYIWHFYNADGLRGEMCGNASRCAAWLARHLGLAGSSHTFGSDVGPIRAEVNYAGRSATVALTPPHSLDLGTELEVMGDKFTVYFVDTGVPHALIFFQDISRVDVDGLGRTLRYHEHFQPRGTNVNFVSVTDEKSIKVRTYERGVEAETLACGTGAAASVVLSHALGLTGPDVDVTTSGSEVLGISLREGVPFLSGAVTLVFSGVLDPAWLAQL